MALSRATPLGSPLTLFAGGALLLMLMGALLGPVVSPHDAESFDFASIDQPPSAAHWFGTDGVGRDLFARTMAGARVSFTVALLTTAIALVIGTIGAVSVFKAVYVEKRDLKCACVGGNSNVPLGFLSLTENLVMIAMGIWMPVKMLGLG